MRKNALVLAFAVSLFGIGLIIPFHNAELTNPQVSEFLTETKFRLSSIGDNIEDYVDQISNLYAPSDIGTHSDFTEMQDFDTTFDTLTEADRGTPPRIETPYADSHTTPNIEAASAVNPTNVYGVPDQTYAVFTKNSDLIVNSYNTTGMTGTISQVYANITYYGTYATATLSWYYELDGGANTQIAVLAQGGTSGAPLTATFNATSLRASWTWANLDGFDVGFRSDGGTGATDVYCDAIYLTVVVEGGSVYDLDLEVGWTAADFDETNEYLCIYGGTQGTEALRVDVWNGAWTNIITDLATGWNNISVSLYLTDATFEIRFTDTSDDAVEADTWQVDGVLLHTWTPSYAPVIDQVPTLDNPSDTDNMYAQYQEYQVTIYVSDQNGFADIDYLEIGLWDNTQATEYCRFRYDEDTNTFTEEYDGGTYVALNTGISIATESGNDINATFYFTVDWDFPDSTDLDARCYVIDTQTESATTWYEVNWDVETRLDYSVVPSINDGVGTADRGDLDGSFSLTGTVIYYTSIDDYPSSTAVDIWVSASEYGTNVGPWSDVDLTSGVFDVTCYADDVMGEDTYTVKVVEEGAGSGGTDLYYTTSATDTYIADRLIITVTDPINQRINIGENATGIVVSAIYDYDDTTFDGAFTLNNTDFDGDGTAVKWGYTVLSVSGGIHGISTIGVNDVTYCIWDSVTITITNPFDQRQNLNANATGIFITGVYDYDGATFDGTFLLNNTDFDGDGTAVKWGYTVLSVSGSTYGITAISSNDETFMIWDSITVTIVGPTDNRQNLNANASGIIVSAVYDYDGAVFDGTFALNNTDFDGDGTAVKWGYTVLSVSGDTYGITVISSNDETFMIWDSITVTIVGPTDNRQNLNANASGIIVSAVYDYDGAVFDGTFTLNNTDFDGDGTAVKWGYTVLSVSGDSYGITTISSNDETYMIWDSITVTIIGPTDNRQNLNANASGIIISAVYDYDGTTFDGIFTLNNTDFDGDGTAVKWGYTVLGVFGDSFGITTISSNDETFMIWDSITITIVGPTDNRQNINANASGIIVSAVYDYDGAVFDGTFTLNNTDFDGDGTAVKWGYTVLDVSGDSFGITTISSNDETYMIWDSVTITITGPTNNRQNLNANASGIIVTAIYDYDGAVFDGTFTLNNTDFDGDGTAIKWGYTVLSVSGDSFGITTISSNDETYMIWDSLTITISGPTDNRQSINANASGIIVSAVYDYDGSDFDGTFTLNNTDFDGDGTAVKWGYTVLSVSGDTYGITAISSNDETYMIWDQLVITIGVDDSTPLNGVQANFTFTVLFDYDDTTCTTYQIVIHRNGTWWHSFTDVNKSAFIDTSSDNSYTYIAFVVTSESTYGILSFSTNSQPVVWSAAPNSAPVNDSAPNLTNPDDTDNLYARYNFYIITSSVSDVDGYNDIEYIELTLYDNSRASLVWTVRYTVLGDIFSVESGSAYITLSTSSFAVGAGNDLDVTWFIKIGWNHSDLTDVDMKQYVYDGIIGDEDFYESNWDVETRLEITGLTIDDGSGTANRGPLDGSFTVSGILVFLNSVDNYPLSNETDVWVSSSEYGTSTGPWSDLTLTSGQFSLTVYADDDVGQDTLTIKAVEEGGGSGGTDLLSSTAQSTYIADRIAVQSYAALDPRININDAASIDVELLYEYDSSPVINGSVTINGIAATHQGSGIWRFTDTRSSVQLFTYDAVAYSGGIHGLTQVNQNAMTQDVIWDQIVVQTTLANATRVDVGAYVEIRVTLWLAYDSSFLGSGDTVTLAGSAMNWDFGNGRFELIVSQASVGSWIYYVNSSSESNYGITSLNLSGNNVSVIWDRIQVQSYSVSDNHVNIGDSVDIDVTLYYDYDDSPVTDGTITVNGISATHQGAGLWRFSDSESIVVMNTYNLVAGSGNIHGLTIVDQNTQSQNVIWDRLVIVIGVDDASSVNGHQANFTLTVTFDYDDSSCTSYQIVIDRNATWWQSFVFGNISQFVDTNTNVTYLYNASLVSSESTYGITAFTTNTQQVTWSLAPNEIPVNDSSPVLTNGDDTDFLYARYRYYIITTSVSDPDGYNDINYVQLSLFPDDFLILYWTIRYTRATDTFSVEFGGSVVTIGVMSNAVGVGDTLTVTWYIKIGWDHPYAMNIDIQQFVTDGTDNDSDFYESNWNIETRLDYSTSPYLSDDRGDINTTDLIGSGSVTYYGSSHSPLANETDVWIIRDGVETWSGNLSAGSFSISSIGSPATIGLNNYTFKIVAEGAGSGGTDLYYTTSLTDTFITDRIEIYEAGVVDGRIDINSDCEVWWRARYEYDDTEIQGGLTIELLGSKTLVWDSGNLYWRWRETSVIPDLIEFEVASASESTYGLTAWFNTTPVQHVIWDSLVISITDPVDQRINVGANASGIVVSAVYAFDGTPYDGSFTLNNTNYQYTTPQIQGYTVLSCSGDTYDITAIGINDETYCIWDRVLVVSLDADELYHAPNDDVVITIELQYEFDGSSVEDGMFLIAGHALSHTGSGFWEAQVTIAGYQTINFDSFTMCNATVHGISAYNMNSNAVAVYWDILEFYLVSVDDGRINVGSSTNIQWSVRLENAGVPITTGLTAQMTGDITLTPSGGFYTATVTEGVIGSVSYGILTATIGEIDQFTQSASDAVVIWDRVLVTSIQASPLSLDVGTTTDIRVTLVYEFDSTEVTDGEVYLNDNGVSVAMSYNSAGGYWSASITKTTAGNYAFTVGTVLSNTHGISSLNAGGLSVEIEWVAVPGFTLDPMTLMLIGGVGIAVIGVAVVASRRGKRGVTAAVSDVELADFGVPEPTEPEVTAEPEIIEPEAETLPEEIEAKEIEPIKPEVSEAPEIEAESVEEAVEPEEVELPPVDEEIDVDEAIIEAEAIEETPETVEPSIPEEPLTEVEPEIEEPIKEPQIKPEYPDYEKIPEEFIEPATEVDLTKLTKKELLDLIPADIRESTSPNELKRLTKQELISLVESFRDVEE